MRRLLALGLAVVLTGPSASAPALKDPTGKDPHLIGDWVLESLELGGKPVEITLLAARTAFTEDGRRITRSKAGVVVAERRYTLGRDRVPARIDIRSPEGDAVAVRGVYAVNGDKLTVCYVTDDTLDRPTKFGSPAGTKIYIAVYKRAPKEVKDDR